MKQFLGWLAAAASVVALISVSAQQTGALWKDEQILSGETITSGTLDLTVGAGGVSQNDFAFAAFTKTNLKPGDFAQAPLTLRNSGNIELQYRLHDVTQTSAAVALNLTATLVTAEANCPAAGNPTGATTALYSGAMIGAQAPTPPQWRVLAPTTAEVWCLRATVDASAAHSSSTTITFTYRAESR